MKIAFVSDIHSNLQAWNAVLLDIRATKADTIVCLGDILGYGPNPAEVLQSVHANVEHIVLGNHDAAVCGKMDESLFTDSARDIIRWSRSHLNKRAEGFLEELPLSINCDYFRCVHGDFSNPAAFNYIFEAEEAMPSWKAVEEQLLFTGHTHQPRIFVLGSSGVPRVIEPQDFVLEQEKRYIVNVGSVGQPRNRTTHASYCLYDTDSLTVWWKRIPFDIDAYRHAVLTAGIPIDASCFLKHDPRVTAVPARAMVSFSPATSADKEAKNVPAVKELGALAKSAKRWRISFLAAVGLFLVSIAGVSHVWLKHVNRALNINGLTTKTLVASAVPVGQSLAAVPSRPSAPNEALEGWSVRLGNKDQQSVRVTMNGNDPALSVVSGAKNDEVLLSSAPIMVAPGQKFTLEGFFCQSDNFSGNIMLEISLTRDKNGRKETNERYLIRQPGSRKQDGWTTLHSTFTLPADSCLMRLAIRGAFTGGVLVKNLALKRKDPEL